jgi:dynein heavy chain
LYDSNLAKFLNDDIPLFNGIVSDLFPGVEIVDEQDQLIVETTAQVLREEHIVDHPCSITKVLQLYDAMRFRHGVMLVGPTCGRKTTVYQALFRTNSVLSKTKKDVRSARKHNLIQNHSIWQMYGMQDSKTQE